MIRKIITLVTLFAFITSVTSCVYAPTYVKPLDKRDAGSKQNFRITKPVKAHLHDGGLVIYKSGFEAVADTIITTGRKYDLTRHNPELAANIPLSEVASLEYYTASFDYFAFLISIPGTSLAIFILGMILRPPDLQMG